MRQDIAQFTDGARELLENLDRDYQRAGMSVTSKDRAERLASWLHGRGEFPRPKIYPATYTLNPGEREVLRGVGDHWGWDEYSWGFRHFMRDGFDRSQVRRACRSLATKGLMRYQRGLMTEDGEAAGAGYGITERGRAALGYMTLLEGRF